MSYSAKWQQAKAARGARRAADPEVQQRAREHAEKAAAKAKEQAA